MVLSRDKQITNVESTGARRRTLPSARSPTIYGRTDGLSHADAVCPWSSEMAVFDHSRASREFHQVTPARVTCRRME